jgi:hypothetical protein
MSPNKESTGSRHWWATNDVLAGLRPGSPTRWSPFLVNALTASHPLWGTSCEPEKVRRWPFGAPGEGTQGAEPATNTPVSTVVQHGLTMGGKESHRRGPCSPAEPFCFAWVTSSRHRGPLPDRAEVWIDVPEPIHADQPPRVLEWCVWISGHLTE